MIIENHFQIVREAYLPQNLPHAQLKCMASLFIKILATSIDIKKYYLGPVEEIL